MVGTAPSLETLIRNHRVCWPFSAASQKWVLTQSDCTRSNKDGLASSETLKGTAIVCQRNLDRPEIQPQSEQSGGSATPLASASAQKGELCDTLQPCKDHLPRDSPSENA